MEEESLEPKTLTATLRPLEHEDQKALLIAQVYRHRQEIDEALKVTRSRLAKRLNAARARARRCAAREILRSQTVPFIESLTQHHELLLTSVEKSALSLVVRLARETFLEAHTELEAALLGRISQEIAAASPLAFTLYLHPSVIHIATQLTTTTAALTVTPDPALMRDEARIASPQGEVHLALLLPLHHLETRIAMDKKP